MIVAVGQLDRPGAVRASRVDVGAARQQFLDDRNLPRHHRPVNRLVRARIAGTKELWRLVEDAPYVREVPIANRCGDRLPFGRGAVQVRERAFQELGHLGISAIAGHLQDVPERQRLGTVVEEEAGDRDLVLANRERERRAVFVVSTDERRIVRHELGHGLEVAG